MLLSTVSVGPTVSSNCFCPVLTAKLILVSQSLLSDCYVSDHSTSNVNCKWQLQTVNPTMTGAVDRETNTVFYCPQWDQYWLVLATVRRTLTFTAHSETNTVFYCPQWDQYWLLLSTVRPTLTCTAQSETNTDLYCSQWDQYWLVLPTVRPTLTCTPHSETNTDLYCPQWDQRWRPLLWLPKPRAVYCRHIQAAVRHGGVLPTQRRQHLLPLCGGELIDRVLGPPSTPTLNWAEPPNPHLSIPGVASCPRRLNKRP